MPLNFVLTFQFYNLISYNWVCFFRYIFGFRFNGNVMIRSLDNSVQDRRLHILTLNSSTKNVDVQVLEGNVNTHLFTGKSLPSPSLGKYLKIF